MFTSSSWSCVLDLQNQQHMFDSHLKKTLAASKSDIDDLMNKLTEKESEMVALKQLNQVQKYLGLMLY